MAEDALRLFRAVCARTRDTGFARNSKLSESVERLFVVEKLLGNIASVALRPVDARDLRDASEHALTQLDTWRAASVTKRMMGHDDDVKTALGELCDRVEAAVGPAGSAVLKTAQPTTLEDVAETYQTDNAQQYSSTDPQRMPHTLPPPMRKHPPPGMSADRRKPPQAQTEKEVPRRGDAEALAAAAAADSNAAYTAALVAQGAGHAHIALERMCEAAELGHAAAATRAATALLTPNGQRRLAAPDDLKRAVRYLGVAVDAGDPDAMNVLGSLYMRGGVTHASGETFSLDFVAAAALFKQAGARGCAAADFNLAVCHETGAGVAKDLDKAKALFRRALALGVCKAHVSLGYLAMHDGELSTAARHFERVANGRLVENGLTKADVADATFGLADVHERAADLGVARLQRALANGTPVDQNRLADLRSESFFFVTPGDDENENESESYENDLCTAHDATDAAARRGATLRALELTSIEDDVRDAVTGDLLDKVGEARERCETLTRAAAEAGDGRASFRVGVRMWRTTHVLGPREETMAVREEAARWVLRGADAGCGGAYRWLGDVAVSGACRLDSKKDAKTARALYDLAQMFGDRFGAKRLAWLEEKTWCGAKKQGLLCVFPTAPPKAWRRVVPPEWLDEAIAGRSHS